MSAARLGQPNAEVSSPSAQGGAGPGPSSRAAKQSSRSQRGSAVLVGRHAVAHAAQGIGATAAGAQAGPSRANPPAETRTAAPAAGRRTTPSMRGDSGAAPAARAVSGAAAAAPRTMQIARTTTAAAPAAAPRRQVDVVDLAGESSDDEVQLVGVKPGNRPLPRPLLTKRPRTPAKAPAPAPPLPAVPQAPPSPEGYRCPICLDSVDRMATTPCGHVFCEPCLTMAIKARKQCPKCRKTVQLRQIHRIFLTD